MYGYIFEVTNKKTGETYLGKRCAVSFDRNYFGEENNSKLAIALEKLGRPAFEVKMIMPYENAEGLEEAFASMQPKVAPKRVVVRETPDVVEDDKMVVVEEKVVEEEPKAKPVRKKKSTKAVK